MKSKNLVLLILFLSVNKFILNRPVSNNYKNNKNNNNKDKDIKNKNKKKNFSCKLEVKRKFFDNNNFDKGGNAGIVS